MNKKQDNLKSKERTFIKYFALVMIPIFVILLIIALIRNNSFSYIKGEYFRIHNESYGGIITNTFIERPEGRARPILINNKLEIYIPFHIHQKLQVGDSIYKKQQSDFQIFILKSKKDTLKWDVNKNMREKYFKELNE